MQGGSLIFRRRSDTVRCAAGKGGIRGVDPFPQAGGRIADGGAAHDNRCP